MLETNKIYLGDSYELIKQLEDKSVDCIYTDVPYLYSGYNKHNNKVGVGVNEELSKSLNPIISGFDYKIYDDFIRVSKKVNIFIWLSWAQVIYTLNYFNEKGYITRMLFWSKTNPQPLANGSWLPDTEYCIHIRENGVVLNQGYDIKKTYYISELNLKDKVDYDHPTIKPLELVKRHLLHTTQENDIVLDTFLGSGTTAVACKELNRRYIGFEINPEYYQIAVDRLNGISQQEKRDKENGVMDIFDFMGDE